MRPLLCVLLLLVMEAVATQIHYRSLEQVLSPGRGVCRARLQDYRVVRESSRCRVECGLGSVEVLRGPAPKARLEHSFSTLLDRPQGRVSPIRDGSGLETDLELGETYFFIVEGDGEQLVRVEPASSAGQVRRILNGQSN